MLLYFFKKIFVIQIVKNHSFFFPTFMDSLKSLLHLPPVFIGVLAIVDYSSPAHMMLSIEKCISGIHETNMGMNNTAMNSSRGSAYMAMRLAPSCLNVTGVVMPRYSINQPRPCFFSLKLSPQ